MAGDRQRAAQQDVLRTLRKLFPGKRVELSAQFPDDRTNLATRAHLHCFLVFTSDTTAATLAIAHERLMEPGLTEVLRELGLPELFEQQPRGRFVLALTGLRELEGARMIPPWPGLARRSVAHWDERP